MKATPPAPRAVVFDLDGTLIDSAPDIHAAVTRMLVGLKRRSLTIEEVSGFIGNGVPTLVQRCLEATGGAAEGYAEALTSFEEFYAAEPAARTRVNPGVEPALSALRAEGIALGVCTNKTEPHAALVLDELRLAPLLDVVVGGDAALGMKPDPAPLLACLAKLRASPAAALYVGDSEVDAEAARRACLPFALFSGGYRKSPIEAFHNAYVFDHFGELAAFVLRNGGPR